MGSTVVYEDGVLVSTTGVPSVPSQTQGRDITSIEFLKLGYALGLANNIDQALAQMPSLKVFLDQYILHPGIVFGDAQPGANSMVSTAFARMKAAGFITDQNITDFLAAWVVTYPAIVP